MSAEKPLEIQNARLAEILDDLLATVRGFIRGHSISHEEYRRAVAFLCEVGEKGEMPLLLDVLLESTVDQVESARRAGTESSVEGPFYLPDMPIMKSPCVLPHRADEPGDVLLFSGTVRSTDGAPLAGAMLDLWQADANGAYSHFNIPETEARHNLRARVIADDEGKFEVGTWVPSPYQIPKAGPTGALLTATGRHPWRPAHLHIRLTHEGCETLTTQIFFENDPWIDSDVVGAVKQSLIVRLERRDDRAELRKQNIARPYCALSYDFVLAPSMAKAA